MNHFFPLFNLAGMTPSLGIRLKQSQMLDWGLMDNPNFFIENLYSFCNFGVHIFVAF